MLLHHKKVAIIGAGPVGLTMAKLLQQKGVDVTVYERDKDPQARIWGGTLDLHQGSGQEALRKAGLLERYFALARPMGRTVADEQGNVLFAKEPGQRDDNPEINRNDLRQLLLESLTSDTVSWDSKASGLSVYNGKWQLHFENESVAAADLVIVANGGMSGLRTYVTDADAEDSGSFIIQGEVWEPETSCPAFCRLCGSNILMAAYGGNLLVSSNNGKLTYNVIFGRPENQANEKEPDFQHPDQIRTFLLERFSRWDELYRQLFLSTSSFRGLPARKLPLKKRWKKDRPLPITLIGDAAHLMPPFAGEGVNTGLLDALNLSANLTNGAFDTIEDAISDYEQKMIVYAREAQLQTSRNETAMRHPDFSFKTRFSS
jgi:2-polyprenyl-6-methoxyphenol hydroxylase-like FAD-dependent oxidoreductase